MIISLMNPEAPVRDDADLEGAERIGQAPEPSGKPVRAASFQRIEWGRHAVIAWALLYTYLLVAAPAPDPAATTTLVQEILGWTLMLAILTVFVSSMAGRRLTGVTLSASAIGGAVLAYSGIDCILAGHTDAMFYVMALGGIGLIAHALYAARLRLAA